MTESESKDSFSEPLFKEQIEQERDDDGGIDKLKDNNNKPDDAGEDIGAKYGNCYAESMNIDSGDTNPTSSQQPAEDFEEDDCKCPVCDKIFCENSLLHDHMTTHSTDKRLQCTLCGKDFNQRGNLDRHLQTHAGERSYQCSFCDKAFVHCDVLKRHLRVHTGEKSHHCDICNKNFREYSHLKMHIRMHTDEKPYICQVCNKAFRQSGGLRLHIKTHEQEKKHICPFCTEPFLRASHLNDHMQNHHADGINPGVNLNDAKFNTNLKERGKIQNCPVCDVVVYGGLKKHMKTHAGEKPFICGICNKAFMRSETLEVHIRKHTGENPLLCFVCDTVFLSKSYLKQHMQTCHS